MKIKLLFLVVISSILMRCDTIKKDDFPIILQGKSFKCGPVCLKMICEYYGKNVALEKLEKLSGMKENVGTSLLGLSEAADSIGLRSMGIKISSKRLLEIPLPAIFHWNNNHFIVVYKIENNAVWVYDPAHGKIRYLKEEFCASWLKGKTETLKEGFVLLLEKTTAF